MIVLDATTKKIVLFLGGAITTSQLEWVASYADSTATALTEGNSHGTSNSTTAVDVVTAPAASTQRIIKSIIVHNKDTVSATVTVEMDISATRRRLCKVTLATLDTLEIADEIRVIDSNGALKETLVIGANTVTDAMLRQGAARTVIGRSANSTGNVADISLATDGKFLGSRASAIGAFYPTQRLSKSTTYQLVQDDFGALVDCDTTSAGFTVTLPAPGTVGAGWWCTIRKTNSSTANVVTIARNASETINGASASNTLTTQYGYLTILCDGTNWAVVGVNDYLSATGSGNVPATTTYGDVASIAIPPGEWDLTVLLHTTASGSTATSIQTGISTTSGNSGAGLSVGDSLIGNIAASSTYDSFVTIPNFRILLTSSTTYYQKIRGLFSAGTPTYVGKFTARRVG